MSFASYHRLPTLLSHADALGHYIKTEPIRGRSPELIPLGARRDCDKFSISKTDDGDVDICMYGKTMLRFIKPTEDQPAHITRVQLLPSTYGWGVSEGWTMDSLFHGLLHATVSRKYIKFQTAKGNLVVPVPNMNAPLDIVTLRMDTQAGTVEREMVGDTPNVLSAWKIDRAQANNIRKQYGLFYRFMKGMIGVRKEVYSHAWEGDKQVVMFNSTEFQATASARSNLFSDRWDKRLDNKPRLDAAESAYIKWTERMAEFVSMISPDPDESVQAQNFADAFAFLGYLCSENHFYYRYGATTAHQHGTSPNAPITHRVVITDIPKKLDELVFKYHSKQVFRREPVKEGTVPRTTYDSWVDR